MGGLVLFLVVRLHAFFEYVQLELLGVGDLCDEHLLLEFLGQLEQQFSWGGFVGQSVNGRSVFESDFDGVFFSFFDHFLVLLEGALVHFQSLINEAAVGLYDEFPADQARLLNGSSGGLLGSLALFHFNLLFKDTELKLRNLFKFYKNFLPKYKHLGINL